MLFSCLIADLLGNVTLNDSKVCHRFQFHANFYAADTVPGLTCYIGSLDLTMKKKKEFLCSIACL